MAIQSTTTRRTALASIAGAALAGLAAPPASAAALPLARPTELGKRLLGALALYRAGWRNPPDEATDKMAYEDHEDRMLALREEFDAISAEIAARRVRSMSDIVDRAIVLTWLTAGQLDLDHWWGGDFAALAAPLVALGGVTVGQCSEDPADDVGTEA
jgi:hypothetical protein